MMNGKKRKKYTNFSITKDAKKRLNMAKLPGQNFSDLIYELLSYLPATELRRSRVGALARQLDEITGIDDQKSVQEFYQGGILLKYFHEQDKQLSIKAEQKKVERIAKAIKEDYQYCYICGKAAVTECLYCSQALCNDHHQDTGKAKGETNLPVCKPPCSGTVNWSREEELEEEKKV